jgi:hypothetical protein
MTIEIRPSTVEDVMTMCGQEPALRMQAFSAFEDDTLIAVGGFMYLPNGSALAFLNIKDGAAEKYPVTLVKTFKRVVKAAMDAGRVHLYASPYDALGERAVWFLTKLGFRKAEEGFYKWGS